MIARYYVEKKDNVEARNLARDLRSFLSMPTLSELRILRCYDVEGLTPEQVQTCLPVVFYEPMADFVYQQLPPMADNARLLYVEPLPGQFDQCADSAEQCCQLLLGGNRPTVRAQRVYAVTGLNDHEFDKLTAYLINPVESRRSDGEPPQTLAQNVERPDDVPTLTGFIQLDAAGLSALREQRGLAMDDADLALLQQYFRAEQRDPTETEIKVVDTYWSDHCRHTTFSTVLDNVVIHDPRVQAAFELYQQNSDGKPLTLMRVATAAMKTLKKQGGLPELDESEEVNACTIKVTAVRDGQPEDWLLLFKNETHNHPTEIEPFGGAATCIGGAIRDPLSGRAFVYQAMRVTGSGNPLESLADTWPGKLPQRQLTTTAAAGYSSYGNQIGLPAGLVDELYHDGYKAKRMEIGAVVGAAPAQNVVRLQPQADDIIVLLGGRTGRDGIGGATGSSKAHTAQSVDTCAAEVQKGNAPEEHKIQRLFRDGDVTRLIKRCNDFGAGGVCVAIGELADGLTIDLDAVPKKYEGLNGTELAISESQERMAVVVDPSDFDKLLAAAEAENIETTKVAVVTAEPRLKMTWRGQTVVDIARDFLNTNGADKHARAEIVEPTAQPTRHNGSWLEWAESLEGCSRRGLVQRFCGSVGAGSVLMPFGGRMQIAPTQVMAALLPVDSGEMETCSVMSYAFDPVVASADPFGAAADAVVESVAKLIAAGVPQQGVYLTLQEYYPRLGGDAKRWGLPLAALLGAFSAQMGLQMAAIGGKDSMSGSFNAYDVPPTLVSFAIGTQAADRLVPDTVQALDNKLYWLNAPRNADGTVNYLALKAMWNTYADRVARGEVKSARAVSRGGVAGAIMMMCVADDIGFESSAKLDWLGARSGGIVFESECDCPEALLLGSTIDAPVIIADGQRFCLDELRGRWQATLESVFPSRTPEEETPVPALRCRTKPAFRTTPAIAKPRVVIPVFPGTNSEYDSAQAVRRAGGIAVPVVVRNLRPDWLAQSVDAMRAAMANAQMMFFPGGFSGGDEPDGSGKFIAAFFRNAALTDAVRALLQKQDGLILGVCNGFQALTKLGLTTYGDIVDMQPDDPTLAHNTIGRHVSQYVYTRVATKKSPWTAQMALDEVHAIPVSHGEGRFTASAAWLERLTDNGQIAFQYCDASGVPSMDYDVNPNGSALAIEGICSPDGRVLGKMGHTERSGPRVGRNIEGEKYQPLLQSGMAYFG